MYKILLVEDIDLIRRDILEMIDWETHGYIVSAEARNGEQGLMFYKEKLADIVITDIKMPVMDGLEMIRQIQQINQQVQFILLTAYEEFDYAKQAIKMGIHSYLLKHELDQNVLLAELEKVTASIDQNKSYQLLSKGDTLRRWLNGNDSLDPSTLHLYSWTGQTTLILLETRDSCFPDQTMNFHSLISDLRNRLPEHEYVYYSLSESLWFFLLKTSSSLIGTSQSDERTGQFISILSQSLEARSTTYAISVGPSFRDINALKKTYLFTRTLLLEWLFFQGSCILLPSFLHGVPDSAKKQVLQKLAQLSELLNDSKFYHAQKIVRCILEEKIPLYRDLDFYRDTVSYIIKVILEIRQLKLPMEIIQNLTQISASAMQSNVFSISERICLTLEQIQQTLVPRYSRKIEEAIHYIKEHYQEDITLNSLSEHLGISPLYVSQLFKKEVGINLMAYITRYRIQLAEELLKSGKYKVYEVSEMVGYQTVQYFSNCFKKETGRKPSEYSQIRLQEGNT